MLKSEFYNLPHSQLLQHIKNSLARAVVKAPKFSHTTPILKSLHWLKVNERIEYKILSLSHTRLYPLLNLLISIIWFLFSLLAHSFVISHHHRSSILIFLSQNHRSLFPLCIFGISSCLIPSTSFIICHHVHTIHHFLSLPFQTKNSPVHKSFPPYPRSSLTWPDCPLDFNWTACLHGLRTTLCYVLDLPLSSF